MTTIRTTRRLADALGLKLAKQQESATADSLLGEWYGNLVGTPDGPLMVLMNARTRLLLLSRETHPVRFIRALPKRLQRALMAIGVPDEMASRESEALQTVTFAKTDDRKLVGSLSELCNSLPIGQGSRGLDSIEDFFADWVHCNLPEIHPYNAVAAALGIETRKPVSERRKTRSSPLALEARGAWVPEDSGWEEDELPDWMNEIVAHGPREAFELEGDDESDVVDRACDLMESGEADIALQILMSAAEDKSQDPDVYAHLGLLFFDASPKTALTHYKTGAALGAAATRGIQKPVLEWSCLGNRPYLRCLSGQALCLWRLGKPKEAAKIFRELLWLNPRDNQGARFCLASVEAGEEWRAD